MIPGVGHNPNWVFIFVQSNRENLLKIHLKNELIRKVETCLEAFKGIVGSILFKSLSSGEGRGHYGGYNFTKE